jgi:uncharacterized RDD family membrane protein YckC
MLQVCPQCGAVSMDGAGECSFCDTSFAQKDELQLGAAVAVESPTTQAEESAQTTELATAVDSAEPEWRLEVARRLEAYRARHRRMHPDDSQAPLPFAEESTQAESASYHARLVRRAAHRPRRNERVEIRITQPELDFAFGDGFRSRPNTALVPVADLLERRRAGQLDAFFLTLSYAGFLYLFRSLGGQFSLNKFNLVVYASTFFLFYSSYFTLFTTFDGTTPGMQLRKLAVVNMDGGLPRMQQLMWRSFGYVLSGATLFLGFLWAHWDEDHLTWQDRISQTYVTAAAPLADAEPFEHAANSHGLAHK